MTQANETKPSNWQRVKRYGPLLLWLGFIFFASTDNFSASKTSRVIGPLLQWLLPHWDEAGIKWLHGLIRKAGHFSEYALMALLAARAFTTSSYKFLRDNWFWVTLALIAAYAAGDEYHQSFVPTRTASPYDSMIDFAGGLTALVAVYLWRRKR